MLCPVCSHNAYKNGHSKGIQKYWCDKCKLNFRENHPEKIVKAIQIINQNK